MLAAAIVDAGVRCWSVIRNSFVNKELVASHYYSYYDAGNCFSESVFALAP